MQVMIVGIGDAFTRQHYGTSAMIRGPRGNVMLDCPDAIHKAVHEARLRAGWEAEATDADDVILTHLHGDHCNGLESLGFARLVARFKNPGLPLLRVHTGQPTAERLWERLAPAMDGPINNGQPSRLEDFFQLSTIAEGQTADVAGLSVRARFTKHPIPTIGLLISDGRRTLGWSGDTPFDREHIKWLSQADLIVHEANVGPLHTAIESLNDLSADLRAKMRLIHVPDLFDPSVTDISIVSEGQVLDL